MGLMTSSFLEKAFWGCTHTYHSAGDPVAQWDPLLSAVRVHIVELGRQLDRKLLQSHLEKERERAGLCAYMRDVVVVCNAVGKQHAAYLTSDRLLWGHGLLNGLWVSTGPDSYDQQRES